MLVCFKNDSSVINSIQSGQQLFSYIKSFQLSNITAKHFKLLNPKIGPSFLKPRPFHRYCNFFALLQDLALKRVYLHLKCFMRWAPGVNIIKLFGLNLLTLFVSQTILQLDDFFLSVLRRHLAYKKSQTFTPKKFYDIDPGLP